MESSRKNFQEKIGDQKRFFKEKIWKVVRKQIKKSHEKNFYIRKTISDKNLKKKCRCAGGGAARRRRLPAARGELAGGGRQELAHRRSLEERATAVAELVWRRSPQIGRAHV